MNNDLVTAMRRATDAVREGQPNKATAIVRDALGISHAADAAARSVKTAAKAPPPLPKAAAASVPAVGEGAPRSAPPPLPGATNERRTDPLGTVVKTLKALRGSASVQQHGGVAPPPPTGAQFLTRTIDTPAGSRDYRLYVPSETPRGLLVMLHGCTQDPDDFAAGTGMNPVAEAHGLVVAYPAQTRGANTARCWNWFDPAHQRRDAGEPAILAELTRTLRASFGIAPERVFVAGLSAGGAMAAVMAASYPELYAAVGIHSGLGYGAASNVMSAMAAMKSGAVLPSDRGSAGERRPRLIVFHGSSDTTVAPANADSIFTSVQNGMLSATRQRELIAGAGRSVVVNRLQDAGTTVAELWMVDGMGHAWSGGTSAGSYTDPSGPDASSEMVRFFLAGN